VFVQSWIAVALFQKVQHAQPPANASVSRVDVSGTWGGGTDVSVRPVFYASDGTRAWIALPPPATTTPTGAPARLDWWIAPDRVVDASAGRAALVPTVGTQTDPPSTTASGKRAAPSGDASSGSAWPWIIAIGAVGLALIGGFEWWRRHRVGTRT